jgi:DNA-binding MarR family transcriptional regulator
MVFDPLVTNPGRLEILTALANETSQPFVELRRRTGLTDGNLATHARRLQSAGLVAIEKSITDGKPLTTLHLTHEGREALTQHARQLLALLEPRSQGSTAHEPAIDRKLKSASDTNPVATNPGALVVFSAANEDDDWVD